MFYFRWHDWHQLLSYFDLALYRMLHNVKCTSDQTKIRQFENNNDNLVMPLSQLSQREKFYIDALMRS
ncbi:hypothetical protein RIR_jg15274.t1 [Rhizophagus irregularis DAOM 181602=DAOM 197198]|nr:hypothetical protein RIR_jg15274.t1 [Rhizophagus irregularis DAOM 181602=DAOM 197198]CAB5214864.1 unnamed protein product [Rhizophagus irregularis]